ncbi:MAG: DUF2141 domain-containing protein [Sphingobium sp.]|jgi:uncharacterized protein (DUF2141 family)|nr:DUF2141 domain-containing protein [Sphingobium sp.]MCI1272161.1 DUF2141 domain-containing protein [Sphingobium sp.]MCI1756794.1 DUF2141 domain-containing protein [Sphingobium sp.]MCI2052385.1 DUF2141 domain-containing protein [Sphingobium sp.]
MNSRSALALALAISLLAATGNAVAQPGPASLDVTVTGLHSTKGALLVCLWKDKAGFPTCQKSKTAMQRRVAITATTMRVNFAGIAPGRYAVTAQHDEDGDGKLKTNFIGMPKEGVGISNNPGGMPGYDKSLVQVGAGTAIEVRTKYLFGG